MPARSNCSLSVSPQPASQRLTQQLGTMRIGVSSMFDWITPEIWRRMIRAAFESRVGLTGVQQAIRLWDDNFAEFEDIQAQIRPFVYAFSQSTGQPDLRVPITLQLITLLRSPVETLPEDPSTLGEACASSLLSAAPSVGNESQDTLIRASLTPTNDGTLATMVLKIREILSLQPNKDELLPSFDQCVLQFVSSEELKLLPEQITHWITWAQAPYKRELASLLNPKQCSRIVNQTHAFMIKRAGSVLADEWLYQAIQSVELTPTGRAISPKLFL